MREITDDEKLALSSLGHERCTDKAPCGPQCPHWDVALSEQQVDELVRLSAVKQLRDKGGRMSIDHGFKADLGPLHALTRTLADVTIELEGRRRGDAEAIRRLTKLATSLGELDSAPKIRARLREELAEIVELLQPPGPVALAPNER